MHSCVSARKRTDGRMDGRTDGRFGWMRCNAFVHMDAYIGIVVWRLGMFGAAAATAAKLRPHSVLPFLRLRSACEFGGAAGDGNRSIDDTYVYHWGPHLRQRNVNKAASNATNAAPVNAVCLFARSL